MSPKLRAESTSFQTTPSGFYAYHTPPDFPHQYRLHLRVLPDGDGVLIVNAASILHLNQTGAYFAWAKMQGGTEEEILKRIQDHYKGDSSLIKTDYRNFVAEILNIVNNPDQAPIITSTGFDTSKEVETAQIPLRINACLTYRNETDGPESSDKELSTHEWGQIIRKTFEAGIPQIVFFGGEPTMRDDLDKLLAYTEELGLVSGLVTSSNRILDGDQYLVHLNEIGLDHLVLEVDPEMTTAEDLRHVFDLDLFTCIRFAVNENSDLLEWALSLIRRGANALHVYPADLHASQAASTLYHQLVNHEIVLENDIPLPLPTSDQNQTRLFSPETDEAGIGYSLTVLPDGTVCEQSDPQTSLGNINQADWGTLITNQKPSEE